MTKETLTEQEKAALAAEDKRARTWVRIQQEEAARLADDQRAARVSNMSPVEFDAWSREQIARGDAARREVAERTTREEREAGAKLRGN